MEKPTKPLDEWFAEVDALLVESDAQNAALKATFSQEKVGELILAQEFNEPLAA